MFANKFYFLYSLLLSCFRRDMCRVKSSVLLLMGVLIACSDDGDPATGSESDVNVQVQQKSSEHFINHDIFEGYRIELIENCGVVSEESNSNWILFNENVTKITKGHTWSHIRDTPEYLNLAQSPKEPGYSLTNIQRVRAPDCNGASTIRGTLVKKMGDWTRQHVNGYKPLAVGKIREIESIIFDVKFSKIGSAIPSQEKIKSVYSSYLDSQQLLALDLSQIVLGFTISGSDNLKIEKYVVVDKDKYFDKWIRITIPVKGMEVYTGEPWRKQHRSLEDYPNAIFDSLMITAETLGNRNDTNKNGDVLRNFIHDRWSQVEPVPELFKEISLTIKRLEITKK